MISIRVLRPGDESLFSSTAPGVFDHEPDLKLVAEFLADPRHHLAIAMDAGAIVGSASAVHYIHPDKPAELWINEVAVSPAYQNSGVGKQLLAALFEHARTLGCREAWVLTDRSNAPANGLYRSAGGTPRDQVMFSFLLR